MLSRQHFLIEFTPPLCYLKDGGSTNGTRVNGQRVDQCRLHDGDLIEAGKSQFRISVLTTWDQLPVVRCRVCGIEPPGEILTSIDPTDSQVEWFCPACRLRRLRYPTPPPGFWIEQKIGGGGMGEVYRARELQTGKSVAIKMMIPTVATGDRARFYFRREMEVLEQLLHPHIVKFYQMFDDNGQFQLVMEYVDGLNANDWMTRWVEQIPISVAARIGIQLLGALEHAHEKGFVHRDIKPSNLLMSGTTDQLDIKLSDFGLAKNFRDEAGLAIITHQGVIGGSCGFLSPDHIRDFREVREPGDIYSAGATLYYILTGCYPFLDFDPTHPSAFTIILEHPPVPLRVHRPDAPEGLDRSLRKSLEKQPKDRWRSAAAMADSLRPFLEA